MNVLFTTGGLNVGGAESWVLKLTERLDRRRFAPSVVSIKPLRAPDNALLPEFRRIDVPVYTLNLKYYQLFFPLGTRRMKRLMERIRPDLIQTILLVDRFFAARAAAPLNVPVIASFQGISAVEGLSRFKKRLYYELLECSDTIVAVSEHTKDFLPDELQESTEVIYNFVDAKYFAPSRRRPFAGKQEFTLGTVSRLVPVKNIPSLLRLFAGINERLPFVNRLLIVGDGPERARIEQTAAALGILDSVEMAGSHNDVRPWHEQMDFFVSTSLSEGMPNAMLEAMSAGIIPIVTAVGGVPEAVVDGHSGFLLDPDREEASLEKLEQIFIECVKNPSRFNAMSMATRKTIVSGFSSDVIVPQYEALFTKVAESRETSE